MAEEIVKDVDDFEGIIYGICICLTERGVKITSHLKFYQIQLFLWCDSYGVDFVNIFDTRFNFQVWKNHFSPTASRSLDWERG